MVSDLLGRRCAALLDEKGCAWAKLARELGLSFSNGASSGSRIGYRRHARFLEAAAKLAKDPLFGLSVGDIKLADYELVGQLLLRSSTTREALDCLLEFHPLITDGLAFRLDLAESEAFLWGTVVATDTGPCQQVHLTLARRLLNMLQELGGGRFNPRALLVGEVDAALCSEIGRRLRLPVAPGGTRTTICFPAAVLDLPIATRDERLARLLRNLCLRELAVWKDTSSPRARIAAATIMCLETGSPTLDRVAAQLDLTPSALVGQLNSLGMGHREFVDSVRKGLAEEYLARSELSLTDIAQMLRYAELAAFNHAYRRWTGMSPRQRRRYLQLPQPGEA